LYLVLSNEVAHYLFAATYCDGSLALTVPPRLFFSSYKLMWTSVAHNKQTAQQTSSIEGNSNPTRERTCAPKAEALRTFIKGLSVDRGCICCLRVCCSSSRQRPMCERSIVSMPGCNLSRILSLPIGHRPGA
jgi:hypothetical protein